MKERFWPPVLIASIGCVLAALTAPAYGVPASPSVATFVQPDGTEFQATLKGDEFYHWHETVDGTKIIQNSDTGFWEYARLDASGDLLPSGLAVGKAVPGKEIVQPDMGAYLEGVRRLVAERAKALVETEGDIARTPPSGTISGLVLLANFSDTSTTFTSTDFTNLMNSPGYNANSAHGSVRDYFLEVSYGALTINTTVSGWYTLPNTLQYYGQNVGSPPQDDYNRVRQMITDTIFLADPGINFSSYDSNGDNWIDFFAVIHQGQGEEQGGASPDCIWSHQGSLSTPYTTGEGVKIQLYHTEPELYFARLTTIGVICHESGHFFGLPDLYDTDYTSEGIGMWGLMGSGSWCGPGNDGSKPCHTCGWSKIGLGWVTPTDIIGGFVDGQSLPALDQSATVLRVFVDEYRDGEYFTVANRFKRNTGNEATGFDQYLPGSGAMIMHVDDYMPGNTNESHKKVDVEEADGLTELDAKTNRGNAGDVFSSGSFNDGSTPNARDYGGNTTGIVVTDFQGAGTASMTVDVTPRSAYAGYGIGYDAFGAGTWAYGFDDGTEYAAVRFTMPSAPAGGGKVKRVKTYFPHTPTTTYTVKVYDTAGWNGGWLPSGALATETATVGPGYYEIPLTAEPSFGASADFYVEIQYVFATGTNSPIPLSDDHTDDDRSYYNSDATMYSYLNFTAATGRPWDINIRADIEPTPPAVDGWELY